MNERELGLESSALTNEQTQLRVLLEHAEEIAERAHRFEPDSNTWGFYGFSDGPVNAAGATGGFLWFVSREEMVVFITQYLPLWCAGPDCSDHSAVTGSAGKILSVLEKDGASDSVREQLNEVLKGYAQIEWWGRFCELLSGNSVFSKQVRKWFWSAGGAVDCGDPIPTDQGHRFSELLQEYGI